MFSRQSMHKIPVSKQYMLDGFEIQAKRKRGITVAPTFIKSNHYSISLNKQKNKNQASKQERGTPGQALFQFPTNF